MAHPARWGLRIRSALIVAVVVTVALAIAALSLTYVLYRSLISASDDAAAERIRQISSQLALESPADLDRSALAVDNRVSIVQIIDQAGQVVQSSAASPPVPITDVRPPAGGIAHDVPTASGADEGRLSAATLDGRGGPYTVVVAIDEEEAERTIKLVALLIAVATPFIVALAALAAYTLIGRSLRSVENIRTRVAAITSADLSGRVPVPPQRDEIAALAVTMNDMLARIESGHNAQRRFISDASHELRSPLTTITAALELGRARPAVLDSAMLDDTLLPEAERMRHLIDDLLLLARADENALTRRQTDVDLDDILSNEVARTRTTTALTITIAVEPARITGDPAHLGRAVRNLLDNATRYAATTIDVRLHLEHGHPRIEISDDGPGIAEPDRPHVFDRFYRPQHDRGRGSGGSGLGLAIVAEIVAAHHGTVRIEPNLPTGTLVTIDLPGPDERPPRSAAPATAP
ncbi:HAMP domain-containing protein [Nocardia colli]|uniref:histidine kinase n=1 Tax=Nocardia colli TaxID=2545717 RepID=A0A5N0E8D5_9NOCA|nr:ATP-binding protein [Nocardia colli]KAA8885672.1 HAMP domain-containing protein [Nocardia colli]